MKFFKSPLFVAAFTVILGAVFLSIVFLQSKSIPNAEKDSIPEKPTFSVTSPDNKTATFESSVENKITTEKQQVLVSFFGDDNRRISSKEVPLYEVTKVENGPEQGKVLSIVANGDLAKKIIDDIKLPNEELAVDKDKTIAELEKSIKANNDPSKNLDVKVITKKSEVTKKMKEMGFSTLLAKFKTTHEGHIDDAGRNVNLAIASKKINDYVVKPKGKFSFNKVVGERSKKNGFKEAGVISQGRVIPGLGGGICQVSTTLYRAVLLSGAKIDERHNHSIYDGIEYAQRGLDAAVAWGYKDFRFTNNLDIPILIKSTAGEGWVEVSIFAEKKPFESIELSTRNEVKKPFRTEKRVNTKLKNGEVKIVHPGVTGYTIEAYRKITSADGKAKEERLSKDNYLTYNRIEERNK